MQNDKEATMATKDQPVILTPEGLLEHWQGHRRVTRRTIEAFPEDKLFSYSIGGMRSFSELAMEMIKMTAPSIRGVISGDWKKFDEFDADGVNTSPETKEELLQLWDWTTEQINTLLPQISMEQFQETVTAFGQWTMPVHGLMFYVIDNEIHHRGQGYVYLRSLDIEPPLFPDRS